MGCQRTEGLTECTDEPERLLVRNSVQEFIFMALANPSAQAFINLSLRLALITWCSQSPNSALHNMNLTSQVCPDITSEADTNPTRHRYLQLTFTPGTQSHYFTGLQYEQKLNRMLADAGIAFWTEEHLRDKGFFKTPDAKLQVTCVLENCWCVCVYGSVNVSIMCEMLSCHVDGVSLTARNLFDLSHSAQQLQTH